jgi:hypothetical protein
MGTEAVWVPLVLSAVSAGAAYVNQKQTANRQNNELLAQLTGQRAKQREADAKTAALIQSEQKSTDVGDRAKLAGGFGQALAAKTPAAISPLDVKGAVSSAYDKSGADAQQGIVKFGADTAGNLADLDAPFAQRMRDRFTEDRYKDDINQIGRFNRGDTFLSNMRLANIKGNPKLALLSSLAGTAAKGTAMGYGMGGGTGAGGDLPNIFSGGGTLDYSGGSALPNIFDSSQIVNKNLPFNFNRPPGPG